jgi:hypothetical protein
LAIGAGVLVLALAAFSESANIFSSGMSCSSTSTQELVAKIAREQIARDGYMMFVVDSEKTKVSLDAIRTQTSNSKL